MKAVNPEEATLSSDTALLRKIPISLGGVNVCQFKVLSDFHLLNFVVEI